MELGIRLVQSIAVRRISVQEIWIATKRKPLMLCYQFGTMYIIFLDSILLLYSLALSGSLSSLLFAAYNHVWTPLMECFRTSYSKRDYAHLIEINSLSNTYINLNIYIYIRHLATQLFLTKNEFQFHKYIF